MWGSKTVKDVWFQAQEEVVNITRCQEIKNKRTPAENNRGISEARGIETMDVLNLDTDEDDEYEEEYELLARMQEIDLEEQDGYEQTEYDEDQYNEEEKGIINRADRHLGIRTGRKKSRADIENHNYGDEKNKGNGKNKGGVGKKNKKGGKKKGGSGKNKKRIPIPNRYGVTIKSWGETRLFNLKYDPEERYDISADNTDIVEMLKARAKEHFMNLQPQFAPKDDGRANPLRWGGFWSPGWCNTQTIQD